MSLRLHVGSLVVGALALTSLACSSPPSEISAPPENETGAGAQTSELPDAIGTIEGDERAGTRIAVIRNVRFSLTGPRIGELVIGKRYALVLKRGAAPAPEGMQARELVDLRPVKHVIGTLADDRSDPGGMILTTVQGKTYSVHGETTSAFKEIRDALPAHDYAKTLFEVNVVLDRSPSTRFTWLDYAPVPHVRCAQKDAPGVHLDLVDVRPDESLLDGFVMTPVGSHDAQMGPHAECKRDATGSLVYACVFDVNGDAWGRATMLPLETGTFDVVVTRKDPPNVTFSCGVVDRKGLVAKSED
ncbi:MAG: hypothetical protein JST00_34700 [Deltaproteobacteria bacterium]|nr:hypothetical protein [Deltaproteobacteria bacterium]